MSLKDWHKAGWLRPHTPSQQQMADLLAIVDRDLTDSARDLSPDWRFGIAYNAALKLCTVLLHAEGWRPERSLAHYRTLQALPLILQSRSQDDADYLDACRAKRNTTEYDIPGLITQDEAEELIQFAHELRREVRDWLEKQHPQLAP